MLRLRLNSFQRRKAQTNPEIGVGEQTNRRYVHDVTAVRLFFSHATFCHGNRTEKQTAPKHSEETLGVMEKSK